MNIYSCTYVCLKIKTIETDLCAKTKESAKQSLIHDCICVANRRNGSNTVCYVYRLIMQSLKKPKEFRHNHLVYTTECSYVDDICTYVLICTILYSYMDLYIQDIIKKEKEKKLHV